MSCRSKVSNPNKIFLARSLFSVRENYNSLLRVLTQSTGDDVHFTEEIVSLTDTGSVMSVQTDRVDLVNERQSSVLMRHLQTGSRYSLVKTISVRNI